MADELVCWQCGASLKAQPIPLGRHTECLACGAERHVCRLRRHWLGQSEELTREHIMTGCLAFIFSLNLSSGNSGGKNIYDLLDLYLRNEDVTEEINAVLTKYGVKIF